MNRAVFAKWTLVALAQGAALTLMSCGQSPEAPKASAATAPATMAANDFGNDHCMVMPGDEIGKTTLEYNGKLYHFCCPSCIPEFKKDPEKYIKAALAEPAKFGLKTPAVKTP